MGSKNDGLKSDKDIIIKLKRRTFGFDGKHVFLPGLRQGKKYH